MWKVILPHTPYLSRPKPSELRLNVELDTKLLAIRLQKVLPYLISEDQAAYIKNRYIGEIIRKILDIFDFTKDKFNPGIAVFLVSNAFSKSISWDLLPSAIDAYGFGPNFKSWIRLLYMKPLSCE